jgi:hypothetical protein
VSLPLPFIWAAGVLHLFVASVNFFAIRKFGYRENLAKVSPIVREVFWVQNLYIVFVLIAFAALCLGFAPELAGQSTLGRFFSGFLAVFWGIRVVVQVFVYDTRVKRQNSQWNAVFLTAYGYLTSIFTIAAVAGTG